jgi:hypothetical protein
LYFYKEIELSKSGLQQINDLWAEQLCNDAPGESFLRYQPFNDAYWVEKHKLVICNLEQYGYEDEAGEKVIDTEAFKYLLEHKYRTIRNSAILMAALYSAINTDEEVTIETIRSSYSNVPKLLDGCRNTMYMNLAKFPNIKSTKEDRQGIHSFLDPRFTTSQNKNEHHITNFKNFMRELEARILIITGETGADIFNKIYGPEFHLPFGENVVFNNTLYISSYHPRASHFSYKYMMGIIEEAKAFIRNVN